MSIEGIGCYDDYEIYSTTMSGFSRGIGGSVSGETETDGGSKVSAEAHVSHESENSGKVSGSISGGVERKPDGSCSGKVEGKISWEKDFNLVVIKA